MATKSKFLKISKKNGIFVVELYDKNKYTKFRANAFVFGFAMIQKPSKGNDLTFLNSIFGIYKCRTTIRTTFWKPATKLNKIGMFFKLIF